MNKNVKITAALCGIVLAIGLMVSTSQASSENFIKKGKAKSTTVSPDPFARYKGECVGNGVCMEDSVRTWFGKWHEY